MTTYANTRRLNYTYRTYKWIRISETLHNTLYSGKWSAGWDVEDPRGSQQRYAQTLSQVYAR